MTENIFYLQFLIFPFLCSSPAVFEPPDMQNLPCQRTIIACWDTLTTAFPTPPGILQLEFCSSSLTTDLNRKRSVMKSKGSLTLVAASPSLKVTSFTKSIFQKCGGAGLLTSNPQILKTKFTMDHKVH